MLLVVLGLVACLGAGAFFEAAAVEAEAVAALAGGLEAAKLGQLLVVGRAGKSDEDVVVLLDCLGVA